MDGRNEPRESSYDVVVVGAGLGGVSAGAFLAKAGRRVLVVDRLEGPGGYAHVFKRDAYVFDPAIRAIGQGDEEPTIDTLLRALGVRERCTFLPLEPFYATVFPGFRLDVPGHIEEFIDVHQREFPRDAEGIRALVDLSAQVTRDSRRLPPRLSLRELDEAAQRFPVLFKYRPATLGEVLDEYLTDSRLKAIFAALWPYVGLPPSRLSFFAWSAMLMSLIAEGAYYCQGSFQNLVNAFVAAIEGNGGELVQQREVSRILVQDGKVSGVALDDGQEIGAPMVVSNADAMQTFERLVGFDQLPPPFVRNLRRMKPSLSACVVYAATDLDLRQLNAAHETFVYTTWDHDETYADILAGKLGGMSLSVPTIHDPSLAPPGEHLVTLMTFVPFDIGVPWTEAKQRYTDMLLHEIDRQFPGFRDHTTFAETATPRAMQWYSLSYQGAIYGWDNTPQQSANRRLSPVTPIAGLYLSGHWTQPGTGSSGVIYSGMQTAQIALECGDMDDFLRALRDPVGRS